MLRPFPKIPDLALPDIEEDLPLDRRRGGRVRDIPTFPEPVLREESLNPLERAALGAPPELSQPEAIWFLALLDAGFSPLIQISWRGGEQVVGGARLDIVVYAWARRFIFRVQSYWHDPNFFPERAILDDIQRRELEADGWTVRDVWQVQINLAVLTGTLQSLVWAVISGIVGG